VGALQSFRAGGDQAHVVPWLGDEVECTALDGLYRQIDIGESGQHDHGRWTRPITNFVEQAQALAAIGATGTEIQIEQQNRRMQPVERSEQFGGPAQARHWCDPPLQQKLSGNPDIGIVVEQQDRGRGGNHVRHVCIFAALIPTAPARCSKSDRGIGVRQAKVEAVRLMNRNPSLHAVHPGAAAHSGIAMDRKLPGRPRWRRILLQVAVAALVATGAGLLLRERPSQLQVVSVPQLAPVIAGQFRDELALRARVEPIRSVLLDAAEAGRVEGVFVQDGAWVEAGTALYELHSPQQEQLLLERSAEVAQQIANVSVQRSAQAASLAQSRRELAQMQAVQQQAESEYRRIAKLTGGGFMSAAALEEAERKHVLATQLLQQAREDHRVEAEIRQRSLDEMARAVEGLRHGLQLLERARERLTQRAPIAGQLSGFSLQVGASVRPGDRLGRMDDASGGIQLAADIDEFYLPRLRVGQEALSSAGKLQLARTLPQVKDGKARVLLRWPESSQPTILRPGQSLDVRLQFSPPSQALLLPDGPGVQTQVYVREGDELVRRNVQLGRRAAGQVEILAGLRAGEQVLISHPPSDAARLALP
jgi:HlyD family secretion protein